MMDFIKYILKMIFSCGMKILANSFRVKELSIRELCLNLMKKLIFMIHNSIFLLWSGRRRKMGIAQNIIYGIIMWLWKVVKILKFNMFGVYILKVWMI